jgi:hypothetical protein
MKGCRIIFVIAVFLIQTGKTVGAQASSRWTKDDIVSLVKAHFMQIEDIRFRYEHQVSPIAEPKYVQKYSTLLQWAVAANWEKQSVTSTTTEAPERGTTTTLAWNGEHSTSVVELKTDSSDTQPSRQGRISSKKVRFPGLDPLLVLEMRGTSTGLLADFLNGKDVLVEQDEIIDGRELVVVSVNRIPSLARKDSLISKYWLDMKRGGLPLRVELYHKGELVRVTSDVQISEVQPGTFFPTACKARTFGGESKGRWSEGETNLFQVDVNSVKINQGLAKEDFVVKFQRGTHVWNDDVGIGYYEGIGLQNQQVTDEIMLAELADDAKEAFQRNRTDLENQASAKRPGLAVGPNLDAGSGESKTLPETFSESEKNEPTSSALKTNKMTPLTIVILLLLIAGAPLCLLVANRICSSDQ